ncbi:MAG: ribulokinase [Velocimicrobium sp.]
MESKYVIGVDYGTLSARAVLVRCTDGKIMESAVGEYANGVISQKLLNGEKSLSQNCFLQYPLDYLEVLVETISAIIKVSGINGNDIIGLTIDFTSCTMLPVDQNKIPLCIKKGFEDRPHAYVKLWKHHGAQKEANEINQILQNEKKLKEYVGEKISSEVFLPKVLEMVHKDYEIYKVSDKIMEAADWLTWILTDSDKRSSSMAGYKAWWSPESGYPNHQFLKKLDSRMEYFIEEKIDSEICPVGGKIGLLNKTWSQKLGLKEGIAVGASVIDSHAGAPGSGIYRLDQLMLVLGTSSVVMALSNNPLNVDGICGSFRGGIVPGFYALESGLAAVGDMLNWFVERCVPEQYVQNAERKEVDIHQLLSELAMNIQPGSSGLLALDWWNGNKTPFINAELSGTIIGMTLNTKPEEIYKALIEATAFGTRKIIEIMEKSGVEINEIVASGGIAEKNKIFLQIYADITGKIIKVADCNQTGALGAAIYASLAAGKELGGYDSYIDAVKAMSHLKEIVFEPNKKNREVYDNLYRLYNNLSNYMGASNGIMEELSELKNNNSTK